MNLRLFLILGAIIISPTVAYADWQFSKWGMTPQQFVSAATKHKEVHITGQNQYGGIEFIYEAGGSSFKAQTNFVQGGLESVTLKPNDGSIVGLLNAIISKYGQPDRIDQDIRWWYNRNNSTLMITTRYGWLVYSKPENANGL